MSFMIHCAGHSDFALTMFFLCWMFLFFWSCQYEEKQSAGYDDMIWVLYSEEPPSPLVFIDNDTPRSNPVRRPAPVKPFSVYSIIILSRLVRYLFSFLGLAGIIYVQATLTRLTVRHSASLKHSVTSYQVACWWLDKTMHAWRALQAALKMHSPSITSVTTMQKWLKLLIPQKAPSCVPVPYFAHQVSQEYFWLWKSDQISDLRLCQYQCLRWICSIFHRGVDTETQLIAWQNCGRWDGNILWRQEKRRFCFSFFLFNAANWQWCSKVTAWFAAHVSYYPGQNDEAQSLLLLTAKKY